jgi:glycosyltransferase involved in cell wall biosynthesis
MPADFPIAALIPCFHEGRFIRDIAQRTAAQVDSLLVVDDGSSDNTTDEACAGGAQVIRHRVNLGKGAAIKTGLTHLLEHSPARYFILLDGDGQHLPEEIPHFITAARESNALFVVGNRMSYTAKMPAVRRVTNQTMSWMISGVVGQPIPDSQCGFRMFHRDLARKFLQGRSTGYDFETEMLALAARLGCGIAAARVSTIYGDEKSKIHPVRDTLRFLRLYVRLWRERQARLGELAQASV